MTADGQPGPAGDAELLQRRMQALNGPEIRLPTGIWSSWAMSAGAIPRP